MTPFDRIHAARKALQEAIDTVTEARLDEGMPCPYRGPLANVQGHLERAAEDLEYLERRVVEQDR